jgi:hypothetical protein
MTPSLSRPVTDPLLALLTGDETAVAEVGVSPLQGQKADTVSRTATREEWLRKVAQVWGRHLGREVTADEAIQIDAGMGALCRAFIETEKNLKQ